MSAPHPVLEVPNVEGVINFLQAEEMRRLLPPWPRCQDLHRSCFASPTKEDLVLAVSHAWPYGAHPDPTGSKNSAIAALIDQACETHRTKGKALIFTDFLSVPQRPFALWQQDRTPEEEDAFAKALRAFPFVYLQADAVLHIDVPMHRVGGDAEEYQVRLADLEGARLRQLGRTVHVVGFESEYGQDPRVFPFDIVEHVGDFEIHSLHDWEMARAPKSDPIPIASSWQWWLAGASCGRTAPCCRAQRECVVRMRRAPFGVWSALSPNEKGWIFLERFANMVKVALVPEDHAESVAFATSRELRAEILDGGRKLRDAAARGRQHLSQALQDYLQILDQKTFSAVSVDKATNTGGIAGWQKRFDSRSGRTASLTDLDELSDREIVAGLMKGLVRHLEENWAKEQRAQEQRSFVLALSRGDMAACRQLIAAGTDLNAQDSLRMTCLHSAARFFNLEAARLLVEARANLALQDVQGNCAAHCIRLYASEEMVAIFQLLAPTMDVLSLRNNAGVQPFSRFVAWAVSALDGKPYPPAMSLIEGLRQVYPQLVRARIGPQVSTASRLAPTVREHVQEHVVAAAHTVRLHVWQQAEVEQEMDVLHIGLPIYLPWSMQVEAVRTLAHEVCSSFPARFLAVNEEILLPGCAEKPFADVQSRILQVIMALPLKEHFFVLDNTTGLCTHLLWRLQHRIRGALVLNPCGWLSEEFFNSKMHEGMMKVLDKHGELFKQREVETISKKLPGNFYFAETPEDMAQVVETYALALKDASDLFWALETHRSRLTVKESTPHWQALCVFSTSVPLVLACGAFSPVLVVQETVTRLKARVPHSRSAYITDSKSWWEQEGPSQVAEVAELLSNLIAEVCRPKAAG